MKPFLLILFISGCLICALPHSRGADPVPTSEDTVASVEFPLKTPRSRDPVLGGAKDKISVSVWIPNGVKTVRGGICNPFSKGDGVSKHWQAACRQWKFAYVQVDFDAVKKEEFTLLQTGLEQLAKKTGHPELAHLPMCFTGMSRGGGMSMQLTELMPDRTIASVPVCLEVGPGAKGTLKVPVMTIFGEKDGSQLPKLLEKLPVARQQDAQWAIAVQWNRKHEFGQANNLSFVFFDDVITRRVPKEATADKPVKLNDYSLEEGWIGDQSTWSKDGKLPEIQPWRVFKGDKNTNCWLPSERVAATWQAFVGATKQVTIAEPAGLGDGQQFGTHTATKPITVKLNLDPKLKPTKVQLWDSHLRLVERTEAPWTFEVKLKPGIHALHATVKDADQTKTSRPHTIVVTE